jgi:hypothetical protein
MFARAREQIVDVAQTVAQTAARRGRRRRLKSGIIGQQQEQSQDYDDNNNVVDDNASVKSAITVETKRTATNENRKSTTETFGRSATEIFCEKSDDPAKDPTEVLENAKSDITKVSIYLQRIGINRSVSWAFTSLVRGDNRSWEALAVEILRQRARWDSITLDDCEGEYLDYILAFMFNLDNCLFLYLSNLILTSHAAWSLQSIQFCKTLNKLQLDLIDLSFTLPLLCKGLKKNTSLKSLITSRCGLNDDRLHELFTSLPSQLEELRIFGNKCREKGLVAITAVVHHSQHLKILDMSYQHVDINDPHDGEFDVSWLAGALHANKVLRVLDLDNCGVDDGHMTHICAALCTNTTLEEVMLNHNRITATGIALLSAKFGQMKGLKKISMYSNLFDAPQVDAMVSQNHQPRPIEINPTRRDEPGDDVDESETSELDVDLDEDVDYEEETVVEDSNNAGGNDDEDSSSQGEFLSDNSSTPPPSADFRIPGEADDDSLPDDSSSAPPPLMDADEPASEVEDEESTSGAQDTEVGNAPVKSS